ncbi:glycoside hydrolase family protein [Paenibacillus sp. YN15]|uniref:glycoside hydrolase family protein n=1 Tax=Paenibacillus sp. YN15 TaxID=1742774 RepID=UPI00215B8A6B|nr:glycoside hydrolase family protein [Paenibacillus sp. YN15]
MEGYWVWCGSVVLGEDGRYHMFASRWPKSLPMHPGWLVSSEIVRAVSVFPEGPYTFQEVVLKQRGAACWDGKMTHNPHIVKHDGCYLLYYTGSTYEGSCCGEGEALTLEDTRVLAARSNKRIGLAVSKSVFGPWERMDRPILETRPGKFDSFLTSNPAPCVHPDGSVLLVYKGRGRTGPGLADFGRMNFGAARASHYRSTYISQTDAPIFPEAECHLEDPFIWQSAEGYEMIAKDMDGRWCGEAHAGIHAVSPNGLDWRLCDPPQAYSRKVLWEDGAYRVMGSLERPFLLFHNGVPTHLFAATADGPGGFTNASRTWNMVIPLRH